MSFEHSKQIHTCFWGSSCCLYILFDINYNLINIFLQDARYRWYGKRHATALPDYDCNSLYRLSSPPYKSKRQGPSYSQKLLLFLPDKNT